MKPVIVVLVILSIFLVFFYGSSKFTSTQTLTTSASSKYDYVDNDTVLIFYAPWCGHCKKSMAEFIKATEDPTVKVILVNSDDPSAKSLLNKYSVNGFPTIIKGDGTIFSGGRTAREIIEFANGN